MKRSCRAAVAVVPPKTSLLGVVFDGDHDFEGPRAPKAHSDTGKYKPVESPAPPLYRGIEKLKSSAPERACIDMYCVCIEKARRLLCWWFFTPENENFRVKKGVVSQRTLTKQNETINTRYHAPL